MDILDIKKEFNSHQRKYEELFDKLLPEITMDGNLLSHLLKNQTPLMVEWEVMTKKLNYLFDECERILDVAYAEAIKVAMHDKYRDVSISEAREYAKCDAAYKVARQTMNEIRHIRDECRGILESVISQKYVLNNLTNALVAGVDKTIL